MKIVINCIILVIGLFLIFQGGLGHTRPIAVWSDFKAFSACVAADEAAQHVLSYGGENEEHTFDDLLKKIWSLSSGWTKVIWSGVFLCFLGFVGVILELIDIRKKKSSNQSMDGIEKSADFSNPHA